jgi:hypothetical protein
MGVRESRPAGDVVILLAISLALFALLTMTVGATAIPMLNYNDSPRAVGMGACATNLVDVESPLYNPGAAGIFHLDHVLSFNAPNSTRWIAGNAGGQELKSWGVSVAPTYKLASPHKARPICVAIALAFSALKMSYAPLRVNFPNSTTSAGTVNVYDRADCITGAIGLEILKTIRLGAGYTHKLVNATLPIAIYRSGIVKVTSAAKVHDYGFIGQLRLNSFWPHKLFLDQSKKYFAHIELTPSYAYTKSNVGDTILYSDPTRYYPVPEMTRKGPALYAAISINEAPLLSCYWTEETQKLRPDPSETRPHGYELGLAGMLFYRSGKFCTDEPAELRSIGYGVSLKGVTTWLGVFGKLAHAHGSLGEMVRRLDVSFDYAKLNGRIDSRLPSSYAGTKFYKLTLSLAN